MKAEGLTIVNSIDNSQIDEGLVSLKRQLGVVNSEMKANLSAFDKAERSMDQYKTKIDGLNKKMEIQKQMFNQAENELKELNDNYAKAKANVKGVEQAYKTLTAANQKNKDALEKSNASLKENTKELEKAQSQTKKTNDKRDKAYQKLRQLRDAEEELKNSNKASTAQLRRAREAVEKQSRTHKELVQQYKNEKSQVKKLKAENEVLVESNKKVKGTYDKTNTELQQTEKEFKDINDTIKNHNKNLATAEKQVNDEKAALNYLQRTIDKTTDEMKQFNKEQLIANSQYTKTADHLDKMSERYRNIGQGMSSFGRSMSMYVTAPIAGAMGYASKLGVTFDDGMRKVQAISGATGKDLDALKAKAREMGATTKFSASDSAEALNYMAMAGWKSQDMIKGLPGIMSLAAASGEELGLVSDIVTDGLTAFGLSAKDSGHFADVLASASANANTNVQMMGEGFKYAAPVAGALGYSIEDTSIAIGLMSNAGIKGEKAGTALRTMFTNLAKPTKAMQNKMEELGISITDSNGKMLPMRDVLDQLRSKFSGLSKDQQASAAATIFGKEAMSGALAVINASEKDYEKLSKAIDNSEGSAKKMSDTMEKGLGGSLRELRSAAEELALSIFDTIQPALSGMVGGLKHGVDFLNKMPKGIKVAAVGLGVLAAAIGPLFVAGGLLAGAVSKAATGYARLNRRMAENTLMSKANSKSLKALSLETLILGKSTQTTAKGFKGLSRAALINFNPLYVLKNTFKGIGMPLKFFRKGLGLAIKGLFSFGGGAKAASLALRFLTGPIGATITAVTIAVKLFKLAYDKVDWFRKGVDGLGETIKFFGGKILEGVNNKIGDLKKHIGKLGTLFKNTSDDSKKYLKSWYESLSDDDLLKKGFKSFKGFMVKMGDASKKATDSVRVLGKGVSKETEKALEKYVNYSDESFKILEEIKLNSGKVTEEKANKILEIETQLSTNIVDEIQKRHQKEIEEVQKLFDKYDAFNEEEKQNIINRSNENNQIRIQKQQELNQKILDLKNQALFDGEISGEERKNIEKLEKERRNLTVKELSKTAKEQEKILIRMSENRSAFSIEEASRAIKDAEKSRKARKKEAEKQYEDDVVEINSRIDLKEDEKKKLIDKAREVRDKEVKESEKKKEEIVDIVKKQYKDIDKEMDLSNGRVYKNTEKYWNGLKKWWGNYTKEQEKKQKEVEENRKKSSEESAKYFEDLWGSAQRSVQDALDKMGNNAHKFGQNMNDVWESVKGVPGKISSTWEKAKGSINSHFKSISKNSGKWFGEAYGTAKRNLNNISRDSETKWNKISSTAWSNAKSVWKGTGKWFGNAAKSVDGWTKEMRSKSHSRFDSISSSAWSNAKSVWKGFKKWLSRTLQWIKDVGNDMGKAASDLGKSVANKAIDGLNGMIGGINKISKAITDKTLIKPIPKLSTGTYRTNSIATNAQGGLKSSTLAVVNDKGPGNTASGGVQEVIHRADGTFHAPKGKNVIVPLNAGDSVINAADTLKLQRMGVLPQFHNGTKKKNWLDSVGSVASALLNSGKKNASKAVSAAKDKSKNVIDTAKEIGGDALETVEDAAKGIWGGIKGITEDVGEFLENPGALVEKVMNFMKINFGGGDNATVKIVKGAYEKLKKSLVDKVKSWFEEFGGAGDGGYIDLWRGINFGFASTAAEARAKGYPFNRPHHGIDINYPYGTKVYSTIAGKATGSYGYNGGFGNMMQIISGAIKVIYGHLSKLAFTGSRSVRPGSFLGLSGGDPARQGAGAGDSTGPHLHYEMQWNGIAKDPLDWLRKNNGGGKGGVNKSASAWAGDIRRAAKQMKVSVTSGDVSNIISLIKHESGGNAGVTQSSALRDINVRQGNPAKGLLQFIPQTFNNYAVRGHGNIFSGYDQLLAFFNNKYWRSQFNPYGGWSPNGPRRFANGGVVTKHQLAEIGEGNKAEMIVPLTKRTRAIQLIEQAMRYIGMDIGTNNVTVNNDNSIIEMLLKQILVVSDENNKLTEKLVDILKEPGPKPDVKSAEKLLSSLAGNRSNQASYMQGY